MSTGPTVVAAPSGITDVSGWLDGPQPVFVRRFAPGAVQNPARLGVVVVPGFGYSELAARRGWIALAESLAVHGMPTVLCDPLGTGSSAPVGARSWLDAWTCSVERAADVLGADQVVLVGARLGALVAALASQRPGLTQRLAGLVLWSPVVSGRRFRRELGLLASAPPATNDAEGVTFGGFLYPTALLDELGKAELSPGADRPRRLLLLDDPTRRAGALFDGFTAAKWDCTLIDAPDTRAWLDESSELAAPPAVSIAALTAELERWAAERSTTDARSDRLHADDRSSIVEESSLGERALRLYGGVLAAVHHRPRTDATGTGVLLLNSGVERGVGPGGAWVEAARGWAADGVHVLRLDHASTGDSRTRPGQQPHDVYGATLPLDVDAGARFLRDAGCTRVVAVGICASAYSLLERGPGAVDHAVVINPQLYRIGMPAGVVEEPTNHTKYRLAQIDRRLGIRRKVKRVKAMLGRRHPAFAWLSAFATGATKLTVVFGSDDRGLQFLQREGNQTLNAIAQSGVELAIIEGLNHALHDRSGRDQVLELVARIVAGP